VEQGGYWINNKLIFTSSLEIGFILPKTTEVEKG
jgi:hypothetical protein